MDGERGNIKEELSEKTRDALWNELELLQSIIDKFDNITFRIKTWFITISLAVVGFSIHKDIPELLILNICLAFIFYSYEITYRIAHWGFLKRNREIQEILRGGSHEIEVPYLDKYLLKEGKLEDKVDLIKNNKLKTPKLDFELFMKIWWAMLTQYRVALIYGSFVVINLLLIFMMS